MPVSVVKKESRRGRNISRETYVGLFVQDISRVMQEIEMGDFEVVWDGLDERGRPAASGIYFYRLTAVEYTRTRRLALIR